MLTWHTVPSIYNKSPPSQPATPLVLGLLWGRCICHWWWWSFGFLTCGLCRRSIPAFSQHWRRCPLAMMVAAASFNVHFHGRMQIVWSSHHNPMLLSNLLKQFPTSLHTSSGDQSQLCHIHFFPFLARTEFSPTRLFTYISKENFRCPLGTPIFLSSHNFQARWWNCWHLISSVYLLACRCCS